MLQEMSHNRLFLALFQASLTVLLTYWMSLKNLRQINSFKKVGVDCQLLLTMLSLSIERINRDKAVAVRLGKALLLQQNLQWFCYGGSHVQEEKTSRYEHTFLFQKIVICLHLSLYIFHLHKCYSLQLLVSLQYQSNDMMILVTLCSSLSRFLAFISKLPAMYCASKRIS